MPETGNQRRLTEKITMNTSPVQKTGIERPASDATRMTLSIQEPGRDAASTPSGIPTASTRMMAASASWMVYGNVSPSMAVTARRSRIDLPRSPWRMSPTYAT